MKKFIFIFIFIQSTILYSQDLFIGINKYSVNTNKSSPIGFIVGGTYKNFYLDLSSNLSKGVGKKIDFYFKSDISTKTDKVNVTLINTGYDIILNKYHIIPIIGFGYTRDIWQDPIQDSKLDTYYFTDKIQPHLNIGISTKYFFKNYGILVGVGLMERFKLELIYNFNKKRYG
jgi:hypothetical protein